MPRFKQTIPVDDYVIDVLMRDLAGHDGSPAAFIVLLYLYRRAVGRRWRSVCISVRDLADETGLSKSAVHAAITRLHRRQLLGIVREHPTTAPAYQVHRHWRGEK